LNDFFLPAIFASMRVILLLLLSMVPFILYGQDSPADKIGHLESEIERRRSEVDSLQAVADSLKLIHISERLEKMGWPGVEGELVRHSAFVLSYDESHELSRWVAHMILKDVAEGRTTRTNDFRIDPLVSTGSTREEDFFLKSMNEEGEWEYDGYGYDRGHLAPSADFRWNQKALSESYFYSNMTPQHPDFNRGAWAELESYLRGYVIENEVDIYVVTGPVLTDDLREVERSVSNMSLPRFHYKVALDPENARAVGFLMPNEACPKPMEAYVVPIDDIEKMTGLDFFSGLEDEKETKLEAEIDYHPWLPEEQRGDAPMLKPDELGKGRYNTLQAFDFIDTRKKVNVCGTVVSTFKSNNNNVFVNLDKKFPNTVFTLTIWSRNEANFSYPPENERRLWKNLPARTHLRER
jgi:endonuclease G